MKPTLDYQEINRELWNAKTAVHLTSEFYDLPGFLAGKNSLKPIELSMLGDVRGKDILHLQCHFGQDSISLARMGANVTGVDLSDVAIEKAKHLAKLTDTNADFIQSDVLDFIGKSDKRFDIVFATYGTIGWLHDLEIWAKTVGHYLKPGGSFVFVEGHPVLWMMDEDVKDVKYRYFKSDAIIDIETSSYTDGGTHQELKSVSWNHSLSEVVNALTANNIRINRLDEFDYFPYPIFKEQEERPQGQFRPIHHQDKLPLTYAIHGTKM
jgi:2-polyprenyl-3-methyl-5-hydroxy-6-metoxy-1,4-benzoquinol methylase